MSATTENTQLMNLFANFLKDASELVKVKKDTNCLISQIIAHMVTDECNKMAIQNLERIFQRPFDSSHSDSSHSDSSHSDSSHSDSSHSDSSTMEEPLTTSPLKQKQKKIKANKSELNSPPDVPKAKPGRKAKTATNKEEEPVVASTCVTPVLDEPKPKAKKVKTKKTTEEAPTEEAPTEEAPKKEKKTKKVKANYIVPTEEAPTEEAPTEEVLKKEKKIKKVKAMVELKEVESKEVESKEVESTEDLVAKPVTMSNNEELTEEDLLEILSEDEE